MTIINALHGRARMRIALRQRFRLALLLAVSFGVLALDRLCYAAAYLASRSDIVSTAARPIFKLDRLVVCAAPLVSVLLIHRFGLKRTFGLAILSWCALLTGAAAVVEPLTFRILTPVATNLLPGILATGTLVALRLAWPARRRAIWAAVLILIYRASGSPHVVFFRLFNAPDANGPTAWQYPIFALVTVGTAIFAIWVFGFREADGASGLDLRQSRASTPTMADWRAILTNPAVWTIVATEACAVIVQGQFLVKSWYPELPPEDAWSPVALTLRFGTPVAFLAAAFLSDRMYRQTRSWLRARRPLIIVSFVVVATVALIGAMARQTGPALAIIDTLALGVLQIGNLLVVDVAPRRLAVAFIGTVLATELIVGTYVSPWLISLVPRGSSDATLVIVFAAIGAGLAALLLPRLQPATD